MYFPGVSAVEKVPFSCVASLFTVLAGLDSRATEMVTYGSPALSSAETSLPFTVTF